MDIKKLSQEAARLPDSHKHRVINLYQAALMLAEQNPDLEHDLANILTPIHGHVELTLERGGDLLELEALIKQTTLKINKLLYE